MSFPDFPGCVSAGDDVNELARTPHTESKSVFRRIASFVARLRHSPEVNVALSALEQVRPLFRPRNPFQGNAVDLAFQTAAEIIARDKEATAHSISVDQRKS